MRIIERRARRDATRTLKCLVMSEKEFNHHYDGGFCLACFAEVSGIEPDARHYECEACGERRVYGCDELLIMGRIEIDG